MPSTDSRLATLPQRHPLGSLAIAILLCEVVGASGSVFTTMGLGGWYQSLAKPSLAPPNWVFAPVWTTLFALIGIAAWRVWRSVPFVEPGLARLAGIAFVGQYVLNVAWSAAFFGARSLLGGLAVLALLWLAIVVTIWTFRRVDRPAAWLLVPYLAWVSFAGYLNYAIWALN